MPAENIVEVHHLKKSVGQGEHELSILTGVELVVKRGETIALVGESGSGKSTLLAILAGLDDGSSGEVRLVGQPLHNMDEEARAKLRAKHVGFVFQSFMLIPTLNALENVELPALLRGESSAESRNGAKALAANGGNLARVASIEMNECDPRLANCHIEVACDVDNPLVGARGAAAVFGPQKGATPEMVEELEQGLQNYARVLQQLTEINVCQMAGGGAAGGMGIAAAVFLNADIKPGIEIVLNAVNLAQAVQGAALVITGEGRIDSQTAGGKAPLGVASVAKQFNVPVIGIAGVLGDGVEVVHQYGIDAVFSILPRLAPLAEVLASGETNLFNSARNIACAIKIGQGIKN